MSESLYDRYIGKYERGEVQPDRCSCCGQRLPVQTFDRLPTPRGGCAGGWTRNAILIVLQESGAPMTREMLNEAVGVTSVRHHLPYLCMDGRLTWEQGIGKRRWYAADQSAFTKAWRDGLITHEMRKAQKEKNGWRRARKLLRVVRSQLRDLSQ